MLTQPVTFCQSLRPFSTGTGADFSFRQNRSATKKNRDKSEIRVQFRQTTRNPVRSQNILDFRTNSYSQPQIPRKSQELLSLAQICQTLPRFITNPETLPINGLHPEKHLARGRATTTTTTTTTTRAWRSCLATPRLKMLVLASFVIGVVG